MSKILLLNKPFNVLSQFTDADGRQTLSDVIDTSRYPGYYAAGRLDYDSEGLIILTDNGVLQNRIASPKHKLAKSYWVQVEGVITDKVLAQLSRGVDLKDGRTKPALTKRLEAPTVWTRTPPIRFRKNIQTSWIELTITEGKNRQVRRMTAAVGFPTLRLIRFQIGHWNIDNLQPGEYREESVNLPEKSQKQSRSSRRKAR